MKDLGSSKFDIKAVESYWNERPCNIRHSSQHLGSREYFDEVEQKKYFVEPHILKFAEFNKWRNKSVLEIGCGIGTDAANFARNGAKYTGLDLSSESINLAKKRFSVFGLDGDLFQSNFEEMPIGFDAKKFDLIYSFGVIHHSPNPRKIITNARKVISSDGELRIMLYNKESWKSIMIQSGFDQPEAQYGCPIAFSFSRQDVEKLFDGLFKIDEIYCDHIFPYKIEKYKNNLYEYEDWFRFMPSAMFKALESNLGWHLLIKATPI